MDTEQKFYRIWGNEISERSAIWLDTCQLADMQAQGYECEPMTDKLTEASLARMRQFFSSSTYVASSGRASRYHKDRPVTADWKRNQYLTDLLAMNMDKIIMLVEDAVSCATKYRGR